MARTALSLNVETARDIFEEATRAQVKSAAAHARQNRDGGLVKVSPA